MELSYLIDASSLLLRWLHLIVGIAWIGSSFYFVWLDNSLKEPTDPKLKEDGVGGELWAMHGGGFYNPQKYAVAPKQLPDDLHFFFWPSYTTWITGFLLISMLYYFQAATYMIDPTISSVTPAQSVGIGLATLALGWVVYDQLARLLIERSQLLFAVIYVAFVAAVTYALCHLIAGRAAYIHVGAMIATTMSANVFFWIIPAQRKQVAAMQRGEAVNPLWGKRAKQRSYHNNYLTLPVLFAMISNHYASTYNHPQAWLVLLLIMLGSVLIRHFFNLRHKKIVRWEYPIAGLAIIFATLVWIAPKPLPAPASNAAPTPTLAEITAIAQARCAGCHAEKPTIMPVAQMGVMLDTPERVKQFAQRIHERSVQLKNMPLANMTQMTDEERARIGAWYAAGAK
ncbi:urate hydroxylase PuuD [Uliginosibacterium sp. 31-16]|uniref:urate hydroxylase PuuD n=1 Tax=Uliginosibacterium sp. 31-16 TaxID=3068315 RepID=UPI00273F9BBE|nr:urate hydroxylase PuuD [Uliginosibacterium sp. 31-16]MDP5238301.1 urate hydroxylase PuuD [Uliginosibacterium sp. 31-16]